MMGSFGTAMITMMVKMRSYDQIADELDKALVEFKESPKDDHLKMQLQFWCICFVHKEQVDANGVEKVMEDLDKMRRGAQLLDTDKPTSSN